MKIKTLFLSIILCLAFSAHAQFSIGAETALAYTNFTKSNSSSSEFHGDLGLALGLRVQQQWNASWTTFFNLQFFQQRFGVGGNISQVKLRNNYLSLSPQVELKLLSWLHINTGVYGNILLNQRFKNPSDESFQTIRPAFKIFDDIDYGWTGGLRFSMDNFYLRTSFHQNFNSISINFTDINGTPITQLKERATSFVLGVGYLIQIKKA